MSNIFANMLRENTGRALLDSGDYYGRNWERNQKRPAKAFDLEPEATVEFGAYSGTKADIVASLSVYHFLRSRLTLAKNLDRRFRRFCDKPEHERSTYFALASEWLDHLAATGTEIKGLYGEREPMTVNTYNGEDLLSQVIQYTLFSIDETYYVILFIHGGCDVRGGYTRPRVFEVTASDPADMFDNARASIYCEDYEGCGAYWDTENGCYWRRESGEFDRLDQLEVIKEADGATWERGKLLVREDRSAACPCCGKRLGISAFNC